MVSAGDSTCDVLGFSDLRVSASDDAEEEAGEMIAFCDGGSADDNYFDEIVGVIEETLVDPDFQQVQDQFCEKHCDVFEDTEENKLEYTSIFEKYTKLVEHFLERRLRKLVDDFDMDRFMHMCSRRRDELVGDVFDLLTSLGDFEEFKFLMLSYKAEASGYVHGAASASMPSLHVTKQ